MIDDLTVMHQRGFPISPAFRPWNIPDAMPIKARFLWRDAGLSCQQLPLTRHGRGVALGFEVIGEGGFAIREYAKVDIIEYIRLPGHQIYPTGRAQGRRMTVVEAHALGRKGVETGRGELLASIGTETFIPDIIGHNQHDIKFFAFFSRCREPHKKRCTHNDVPKNVKKQIYFHFFFFD